MASHQHPIPACAGLTQVCQDAKGQWSGPSPRAWGLLAPHTLCGPVGRSIPACAGSSLRDLASHQRQAAVFATSRKTDKPDTTHPETNSCHQTYAPPRSPAAHTNETRPPQWFSETAKEQATEHQHTTLRATNPTPHQPYTKPDDSPPHHHAPATPPTPRHTTR